MLQELLQQKHSQIDKQSKRDKARASYLVGLLENDWGRFVRVFNFGDDIPQDELPEKIYNKVEGIIKEMEKGYVRPMGGVTVFHFKKGEEPLLPGFQLGWAEFYDPFQNVKEVPKDGQIAHVLKMTKLGMQIVNKYRFEQDYVSLQEQCKINRQRHEEVFRGGLSGG